MTSYFGNPKAKANPNSVSIARWTPRWWGAGRRATELAPSVDLLNAIKAGEINERQYTKRYHSELLKNLDPKKVYAEYKDKILCCYERPGEFCHRRLIAEWLEKSLGVRIPEL